MADGVASDSKLMQTLRERVAAFLQHVDPAVQLSLVEDRDGQAETRALAAVGAGTPSEPPTDALRVGDAARPTADAAVQVQSQRQQQEQTDWIARAMHPDTPADELQWLAQDSGYWPYLALNPSLYPDLEQWLRSTGDTATLRALEQRPERA